MYVLKFEVWPYGLLPVVQTSAKMQVYCVYNSPPWGICQLTINYLAMLWYVSILMKDKLEELDKKSLLVQFFSSVPGKIFLLASDYLISSSIQGSWCLMPRIDKEVEIRNKVILL